MQLMKQVSASSRLTLVRINKNNGFFFTGFYGKPEELTSLVKRINNF